MPTHALRKIKGNTSRDHIHRIFAIFSELQNKRYPNKTKLAALLSVTPRTIERDLRSMELDMGVEIIYDPAHRGYRLEGEATHFPMIHLEDRDLLTLHFLRQCLAPYDSTEMGRSMIDSFNRSFGLLTGTINWKKWEDSVCFRFEGKPEGSREDVEVFNLLHHAIRSSQKVAFDYLSSKKRKPESRTVAPLLIYMRNGRWYLYALDGKSEERRTFAFARISNIKGLSEKFAPAAITPLESFRYSFGVVIAPEAPKDNVVLEFIPEVANRISESLWHPEQTLEKLPSGGVRLTLPIAEASYLEVKPWLLSWGATVKVLAPMSLADEMRAIIREMADKV